MPAPTNHSGLRDNHARGTVADFLRAKTQSGSKLSIVSAYFTIYAYDALQEALERIEHLDFLFGEPSFVNRLDPSKTEKKAFIIDADGLELAKKLQQQRIARECADWIERKVAPSPQRLHHRGQRRPGENLRGARRHEILRAEERAGPRALPEEAPRQLDGI